MDATCTSTRVSNPILLSCFRFPSLKRNFINWSFLDKFLLSRNCICYYSVRFCTVLNNWANMCGAASCHEKFICSCLVFPCLLRSNAQNNFCYWWRIYLHQTLSDTRQHFIFQRVAGFRPFLWNDVFSIIIFLQKPEISGSPLFWHDPIYICAW